MRASIAAALLAVVGSGLVGTGACAAPAQAPDSTWALRDPAAARRMEGLREVARRREMALVPEVIELLDDPDAGVRLTAGAVLKDLTGRRTDYRASLGPLERRAAVQEWRAWWAANGATVAATSPPRVTPVPPPPPVAPVRTAP
jgi:hypothetical protein